jgi:hypothetical protein
MRSRIGTPHDQGGRRGLRGRRRGCRPPPGHMRRTGRSARGNRARTVIHIARALLREGVGTERDSTGVPSRPGCAARLRRRRGHAGRHAGGRLDPRPGRPGAHPGHRRLSPARAARPPPGPGVGTGRRSPRRGPAGAARNGRGAQPGRRAARHPRSDVLQPVQRDGGGRPEVGRGSRIRQRAAQQGPVVVRRREDDRCRAERGEQSPRGAVESLPDRGAAAGDEP